MYYRAPTVTLSMETSRLLSEQVLLQSLINRFSCSDVHLKKSQRQPSFSMNIIVLKLFVSLILFLMLGYSADADFILACQKGYRISGIRRLNSVHQRGRLGSINIECQPIQERNLNEVLDFGKIE